MSLGQVLLRGGTAGASSGINYLSDFLDTRKIREDALRRMAQGSVSPYARRSDLSGLCSVPDPFASGVGYPAVRSYRYEGHPATGTAGKGGFNLADFGKELLTGFVAGGLSSAAFYGAGKAIEAVKGSVRGTGKGGPYTNLDDGLNFSNRALEHMGESGRQVPMQTLQDAIRYGEAMPDPRGSNAIMYYTIMYKNGKMFNLEVLYDEVTNTVYHFEYARKAMGNLLAISK